MGLLDDTTQLSYYQGNNYGNYQFVSLDDIINQFIVAFVGEDKIVSNIKRLDVAFHAQRALRELSFDTFKSFKSQEIELPASLTMILPHDYVNYTKLSWSDGAGIKHPLYPTKHTSNPFKIRQHTDGSYNFWGGEIEYNLTNKDFSNALSDGWSSTNVPNKPAPDDISTQNNKLEFTHGSKNFNTGIFSRAYAVWQQIDVSGVDNIDLTATGLSATAIIGVKDSGILRVGIASDMEFNDWDPQLSSIDAGSYVNGVFTSNPSSRNHLTDIFNLPTATGGESYIEFNNGAGTESTKSITDSGENGLIDVSNHSTVFVVITSYIPNYGTAWTTSNNNESTNSVDDIKIEYEGSLPDLIRDGDSTTWTNYKSTTPSENSNDDYEDDIYWPWHGERYGLEPSHAQINGSFYIDDLKGLIHFSSNISGKTVILDYISDSLGTDKEMQVHKFAEDAMYKWIMHAILSTRSNVPEYMVRRYQKEKFAATRQAKLRLSNIKLEEITQILRGKSKHIKH